MTKRGAEIQIRRLHRKRLDQIDSVGRVYQRRAWVGGCLDDCDVSRQDVMVVMIGRPFKTMSPLLDSSRQNKRAIRPSYARFTA